MRVDSSFVIAIIKENKHLDINIIRETMKDLFKDNLIIKTEFDIFDCVKNVIFPVLLKINCLKVKNNDKKYIFESDLENPCNNYEIQYFYNFLDFFIIEYFDLNNYQPKLRFFNNNKRLCLELIIN